MGKLTPAQLSVDIRGKMQSMAWFIYAAAVSNILYTDPLPDTATLEALAADSLKASKVFQDMVDTKQEVFYAPYL